MTDHSANEPGERDASTGSAALPSDRDERPTPPKEDAQHRHNRRSMEQAHRDTESDIQDTERIGTPNDVPSSDQNAGTKS